MKKIIYFLAVLLVAFSCSSDNKKAFEEIERAKQLSANYDFGTAKEILDTLKIQYKEDVEVRRAILELSQKIEYAEAERNYFYTDSILPFLHEQLTALIPQFNYEKNPDFEDIGRYVDKVYNPSLDKQSQFLKVTVNEEGDIALVSAIAGAAIKHNQVKVSDKEGNYAETEIVTDEGANYSFKDVQGRTYQTVTFSKGRDNGVIMFIYNYAESTLSLERLGGQKTSPVTLSDNEKQAIKRLAGLSIVLKEIDYLQKEKEKAAIRIEFLRSKINS